MTAHDHRAYTDGCFRCDLSADELVLTPFDVMTDALLERWHADDDPDQDPFIEEAEGEARKVIDALAAAGYQVVTNNLVDACRQLTVPLTKQTLQARAEALQRIRACIAILDDADPTDVFTEGGA